MDDLQIERQAPADVLRVAVAAVLLLVLVLIEWLFGDTLVGFAADLLAGISALPDWMVFVLAAGTRIATIAFLLIGLFVTADRSGPRVLLTVVVAAVSAVALSLALDALDLVEPAPSVVEVETSLGPLTDAGFPTAAGLAAVVAILTAAAPWLSRTWRRCGWVAVIGLVVSRFATAPVAFDSLRSALTGWLAGAAVLVVLGAPTRRPSQAAIAEGLATAGLPLADLAPASVDARGSTPYFGSDAEGTRYFVKALGTDQRSADLLFRVFRYVQRHDLLDERPFSSLRRAVEHEALVALAARDLGIPTPRMRVLAAAEPNGYVLAYEAVDGKSLDGVPLEDMTDDVLAQAWTQIGRLRANRIAHRDLRLANLFLASDGQVWIIDFGFSELAASDLLLANDVAELVASSSAVVGAERARAAHAIASVDADTLAAARERLQPWSLSGATRTAMKAAPGLLDDVRARLAPT